MSIDLQFKSLFWVGLVERGEVTQFLYVDKEKDSTTWDDS